VSKILQSATACPTDRTSSAIGILREGTRNDGLTRLGGAMRRRGATLEVLETALLDANDRRCHPALPAKDVLKIAASVARYQIGGPDPLEVAWRTIQGKTYPSNYERFLALAQQLQRARPEQAIALPLKRIEKLMGCSCVSVGRYRQLAERDGILQRVAEYVPHRRATLYRLTSKQCKPSSEELSMKELDPPSEQCSLVKFTSGLVNIPTQKSLVNTTEVPLVNIPLVTHPKLAQLLRLAAKGFKIFPCKSRAKVPVFKGWQEQATSDPATIASWFDKFPEANWALRTGPESGVWILDVDGEVGLWSFYQLGKQALQLETLGARTSPQHCQLYFGYPVGKRIANSVGKLGEGLDVRGDGGYVLCPPSVHPSGAVYEWQDEEKPIASAPEWLLELVSELSPKKVPSSQKINGDAVPDFGDDIFGGWEKADR
jgi:hypothetical protein